MRRALAGAACLAACLGGVAAAQRAEVTQEIFDARGHPQLVANPVPDGGRGEVVAWRECRPGRACEEIPLERRDDRDIAPGATPADTRWEVDVESDTGERTTDVSLPWQGRVTAAGRPRVVGRLRVGRLVRPRATDWSGGWGAGDYSLLRLEACRTRAGRRCETLSAEGMGVPGCRDAAVVLGRRHRGWWIRAVDLRYAADTAFAAIGYGRARDVPLARPSRTVVRSKLAGPVRPRSGPRHRCPRR
jgi:hypothetical protein